MNALSETALWSAEDLSALQARAFSSQHPWYADCQRRAYQRFLQKGLPTRADEAWKYTRMDALAKLSLHQQMEPIDDAGLDITPYIIPDTLRIVFVDGCYSARLSSIDHDQHEITLLLQTPLQFI